MTNLYMMIYSLVGCILKLFIMYLMCGFMIVKLYDENHEPSCI